MCVSDEILKDMGRCFVIDYGEFVETIGSLKREARLIRLGRLESRLDDLFF